MTLDQIADAILDAYADVKPEDIGPSPVAWASDYDRAPSGLGKALRLRRPEVYATVRRHLDARHKAIVEAVRGARGMKARQAIADKFNCEESCVRWWWIKDGRK